MVAPVLLLVGAGPGLGLSIAARFGRAGYDVALIGRTTETVETIGIRLQGEGITAGWSAVDMTDEAAFAEAVSRFGRHAGHIDHLHFNPSALTEKDPLTLSVGQLLADLHLGVASVLTAVQSARPFLSEGARITATGSVAADRPWAGAASLGVQKAGLRNLVGAIDSTLKPEGIRAMTFTITGTIGQGELFAPDRIADALYEASHAGEWRREVTYPAKA